MELTLETLERHWLPFSDNRGFKREPRLFVSASGMYYRSPDGRKRHAAGRTVGILKGFTSDEAKSALGKATWIAQTGS